LVGDSVVHLGRCYVAEVSLARFDLHLTTKSFPIILFALVRLSVLI